MRVLYGLALIGLLYLRTPNISSTSNNFVTAFVLIVGIVSILSAFIDNTDKKVEALYNDLKYISKESNNKPLKSSKFFTQHFQPGDKVLVKNTNVTGIIKEIRQDDILLDLGDGEEKDYSRHNITKI